MGIQAYTKHYYVGAIIRAIARISIHPFIHYYTVCVGEVRLVILVVVVVLILESQGEQDTPQDHQHGGDTADGDEVFTILEEHYSHRTNSLTMEDSDFKSKIVNNNTTLFRKSQLCFVKYIIMHQNNKL